MKPTESEEAGGSHDCNCCSSGLLTALCRIGTAMSSAKHCFTPKKCKSPKASMAARLSASSIASSASGNSRARKHSAPKGPIARCFLMGVEATGKSTLLKQLQKLCATDWHNYQMYDEEWQPIDAYTKEVCLAWRSAVRRNVADIICTLIELTDDFGVPYNEPRLLSYAREVTKALRGEDDGKSPFARDPIITAETARMIDALWNEPNSPIPYTLRIHSDKFTIPDSSDYFMTSEKLMEISEEDYIPSPDDIIRARDPTTGAKEYNFTLHGTRFSIHDMGGQRVEIARLPTYLNTWTERSRAQDRNYLLYMTSVADYNRISVRHPEHTMLEESANLLKVLLNLPEVQQCGIILFFNKKDLLEKQLDQQSSDFYERFQRYLPRPKLERPAKLRTVDEIYSRALQSRVVTLKQAEQALAAYFQDAIMETSRHDAFSRQMVFCRFTCAVDTNQMEAIFVAVKADVLSSYDVLFP